MTIKFAQYFGLRDKPSSLLGGKPDNIAQNFNRSINFICK